MAAALEQPPCAPARAPRPGHTHRSPAWGRAAGPLWHQRAHGQAPQPSSAGSLPARPPGGLPAFPETAGDTPFLAEANTISVTKKEHSRGGGE